MTKALVLFQSIANFLIFEKIFKSKMFRTNFAFGIVEQKDF